MSANSLGDLTIGIGTDLSGLDTGIGNAKNMVGGFLSGLGPLGGALAGIAGVATGVGVAAVKMAGDFQTSMTQLVTGAGESQKNIGMVSQGILSMAGSVGSTTKDLAAGMYLIESAGQHGAQGLTTLQAAAEGAKVGAASLADVANGVTTIMTDYASKHVTAAQATNTLIAAVAAGKTHLGDLSNAMSTVLPAAAAMNVGLTDVSGAMATMTGEGTNASAAATYLRQLLSALETPAKKGASALAEIGLSTKQVSDEMKISLPDTLQLITDHLGKKFPEGSAAYMEALKNIAGGSKQMQGILELTGSHLSVFKDNVAGITDAVKKGGDSITGWSDVQGDFNFKLDQARASVEALMISVGTKLLPVVGNIVGAIAPAVTAFDDWLTKSGALDSIIGTLSSTLGPLTGAISGASDTSSVFGQSVSDVKSILGEVDAILTTVVGDLAPFVSGLLDAFKQSGALQNVLHMVRDVLPDVDNFVKNVGSSLNTNLLPPMESLVGNVGTAVANFSSWLDTSGTLKTALNDLGGVINTTSIVVGVLVQGMSDLIGWFSRGGPQVTALKDVIIVLGAAFVALKIADTTAQFGQMFAKISEGDGFFKGLAETVKTKVSGAYDDFLSKQAPNLKNALDNQKKAANDAATAEENVGITAKGDMASGVTDGAKASETRLDGVKTKAGEVAVAEEKISTTAKTTMAEGVKTGATESETSLKGIATTAETEVVPAEEAIGTTAKTTMAKDVETGAAESEIAVEGIGTAAATTSTEVEGIGTAATTAEAEVATASAGMEGSLQGVMSKANLAMASINLVNIGEASIEQPNSGSDRMKQQKAEWEKANPGIPFPKTLTGYASGGTTPGGAFLAGEQGPEIVAPPSGWQVYPHSQSMGMLAGAGGGGGGPTTITIMLDSIVLAQQVFTAGTRDIRLKTGSRY